MKRIDIKDHIGKVYGRLTIIKETDSSIYERTHTRNVLCRCSCGKEKIIDFQSVLKGRSKSCGCYNSEVSSKNHTKHGLCVLSPNKKRPEYMIWSKMKARCFTSTNKDYKYYGARGIKVCDRWKNSFALFIQDMGYKPSPKHSIERIDVNKDYSPENCKWILLSEQNKNKRKSNNITFNNKTMALPDWCKELNLSYGMMRHRIYDLKIPFDKAILYPKYTQLKNNKVFNGNFFL